MAGYDGDDWTYTASQIHHSEKKKLNLLAK